MTDLSQPTLEGKVAIVTGAGQGIGQGIARVFAARGVKMVITGRTRSKLEAMSAELGAAGGEIEIEAGDVGDREHVDRAVAKAIDTYGGLDILINNAQSLTDLNFNEPLVDVDDHQVDVPFRSGLMGSLHFMQASYPHLKARGGGSIVNFGSSTGIAGMPRFGGYAIAKEAVRGLTRLGAKEWGPDNIRVNTVVPAALTDRLLARSYSDPKVREEKFSRIPLRRLGDPARDIGRVIAALVGDDMSYLTGATLVLDGGMTLIS